ncbi:MAG: TatD family hydrolase [Lactobacillales bacterium]|nr:TatD family hydrolase [Lactobacillales bacterium]
MQIIDTHCHLDDERLIGQVDALIARARELSVTKIINVGVNTPTNEKAIELADKYEECFAVIGFHPADIKLITDESFDVLREQAKHEKVLAIGEVGLDYHWMEDPEDVQIAAFKKFIELSIELDLPLVIHIRSKKNDDAALVDAYELLKQYPKARGVMHSFAGDVVWLEKFLELGYYVSFSGVVTFKNAPVTQEVAKAVPMDRFIVETDAPYLTPVPHRGETNEPGYTYYTAQKIADLKEITLEEVAAATSANAEKLFKI